MAPALFRIDDRRFKDLILYASQRLQDDPTFGETKLNKVLFFSDFEAYRRLGVPITGAEYQRNIHGPTARLFTVLRRQMENDREIDLESRNVYGYTQSVVVPRSEPTTAFTAEELEIVDAVIEEMRQYSNTQVSDLSHERSAGWHAHELGETIPYQTAILSTEPVAPEVVGYFRQLEGLPL